MLFTEHAPTAQSATTASPALNTLNMEVIVPLLASPRDERRDEEP